ncbi:ATP-dependent DNA helicase II subunit 1 [Ceratobasidium sp. 370]|nr:ATP-dependent DNA helicase II subunit 1 [Ceratobasidium sp. 370]
MYLYQPVAQINAPDIQKLLQLLNETGDDHEHFSTLFAPTAERVTMANFFQTCIHVLRDGASKIAGKQIFQFTDNDDPELGDPLKAKATRKFVDPSAYLSRADFILGYVQLEHSYPALFHGVSRAAVQRS